ncbi:MAG TPA: hypothetical protein VF269_07495 [Rhodanobacteraceae bacterium]
MDFHHMTAVTAIAGIIGLIIGLLICGAVLLVVNRIVNGYWANYWKCVLTALVVGIIDWIIMHVVGLVISKDHFYATMAINFVVNLLVGAGITNLLVRREDGSPLGFMRAFWVFLILAILGVLLGLGAHHLAGSLKAMQAAQH